MAPQLLLARQDVQAAGAEGSGQDRTNGPSSNGCASGGWVTAPQHNIICCAAILTCSDGQPQQQQLTSVINGRGTSAAQSIPSMHEAQG
jgi:hypothetical protein